MIFHFDDDDDDASADYVFFVFVVVILNPDTGMACTHQAQHHHEFPGSVNGLLSHDERHSEYF